MSQGYRRPHLSADRRKLVCGVLGGAARAAAVVVGLLALGPASSLAQTGAQSAAAAGVAGGSGLPVPRYVSLKSDRVNLRKGPGTDYPTIWEYRRAGLPVEVVREYEGWREVRDAEGVSGWVSQSLLSGRRTVLIEPQVAKLNTPNIPSLSAPNTANVGSAGRSGLPTPGAENPSPGAAVATLRASANEASAAVVQVEAGVIGNVVSCDGKWCLVTVETFKGYVAQGRLWGVYQGEAFK